MTAARAGQLALAACAVLLTATVAAASTRYDPRLRFRTLSTSRFDIHFHQGEEAQARRLAGLAEEVATTLDGTLGPADGRVQVVLVNQDDLPNGWATPLPYNLIEIRTVSPRGALDLGFTDDWLRMVFTHEYTHVVHLSRGRGWIAGLRRVFGRHPALFPNAMLPGWQIEGTAVYEESALTGMTRGRLAAADFRALLDTAAAAGRFDPVDRAGGGLDDWPRGQAPYLYGGYFTRFLAERYGEASLRTLADRTATLPPYLGTLAFPGVFGASVGTLWREFAAASSADAPSVEGGARQLTAHGFTVDGPAFGPDGAIYYARADAHGFPQEWRVGADGRDAQPVGDRYLGTRSAFSGRLLVFDQAEIRAQVGLQFDLYVEDLDTGARARLTDGARAADPDVSPDGLAIVCTLQRTDRRDLAILPFDPVTRRVGPPQVLASAAGQDFATPRVSPDGRAIAAERRIPGRLPEVVIVDRGTGELRVAASDPAARFITPAWSRDGRALLMATDSGGSFRIVSLDLARGLLRRLEGTGASARAPALSADGRLLAYVGYTASGYDLFAVDLDAAVWTPLARSEATAAQPLPGVGARPAPPAGDRPYAPAGTLVPRFWTPTLESDGGETVIGVATATADALGRHVFGAEAGWASSRGRPDWQVAYAYDRWWPTLFAVYDDDTDPGPGSALRTRELTAGAQFPWRRVRRTQVALAALYAGDERMECDGCGADAGRRRRGALRAGYSYDSARLYGYSISREDGSAAAVTLEVNTPALGADGDAGSAVVDLRHYQRLWPRHGVLAVRAAAAASWGDASVRRRFTVSGETSQPGGLRFGSDAIALVRGFDAGVAAPRAAVLNLDYRLPLLRIERGLGAWPLFARTLHAAAFADLGQVWTDRLRRENARRAFGAELSLDTVIGYALPLTLTAGAAVRYDGVRPADLTVFGRVGRAF